MQSKYPTRMSYLAHRLQRAPMRALLRPLCRWEAMPQPRPGYTVIIACPANMLPVLYTNLRFLLRQDREDLQHIRIVIDAPPRKVDRAQLDRIARAFSNLPLAFHFYRPHQATLLNRIGWGWCYSWLSWAIGLSRTSTRYAFIHDLDAMLIKPQVMRTRYELIRDAGVHFLGTRHYYGNGIETSDQLAVTFELMLDAAFLRQHFKPIDLFNHVGRLGQRWVEFDTLLHAQTRNGRSAAVRLSAEHFVHPGQLFCQLAELKRRNPYVAPTANNLPLLPYLFYLAGERSTFYTHARELSRPDGLRVKFLGRTLDFSNLTHHHIDWLEQQARQLEHALHGETRPEVAAYFHSLHRLIDAPSDALPVTRPARGG